MRNFPRNRRATLATLALLSLVAVLLTTLWQFDARVARLWLSSARLAALTAMFALPIGTVLAVAIFKTDVPGRRAAAVLLVGVMFLPIYLITGAWDAGFGVQGWFTILTNAHLAHEPLLSGWRAAVWVHALAAVPWVVIIVGASLRAVESEIEEDAATCASPPRVLWYVAARRALAGICLSGVWIAIVTTTEISVTDFFQVRTFAEEVYTQSALGVIGIGTNPVQPSSATPDSTLPALSAAGLWSGLALSTILALAGIAAVSQLFTDLADSSNQQTWLWRLKTKRWPAAILLWSSMLVLIGIPVGNLLYKAGIQVDVAENLRTRTWSAAKVAERFAAAPIQFRGELWLSSKIGAAAATAALALALPLAWSLRSSVAKASVARSAWRLPWLRLLALSLCLTIPGPLLGVFEIHFLNQPPASPLAFLADLYDSNFAPWLAQTIRALPVAILILLPALATVPEAMLDSATIDGAGWCSRLLRIALPQRWPAVAAAWIIAFAIAVGELAATILVMPPQRGATALSIQVFQLLHYGVDDRLAAICLFMLLAVAVLTGIAATLLKRRM